MRSRPRVQAERPSALLPTGCGRIAIGFQLARCITGNHSTPVTVTCQVEIPVTMKVMSSEAAPGQLEHLREFVNTRDIDLDTDELQSAEALEHWLGERDLLVAGARVGKRELSQAIELLETLRELLLAN